MTLTLPVTPPTALALAFGRAQTRITRPPEPVSDHVPAVAANDPARIFTEPGATLDDVLDEGNLLKAWQRVRANGGASGMDGQTVAGFGSQALGHLQALQSEVRRRRYVAQPLRQVDVPKASGGTRPLAVPAVRDRVLQTAVALVLGERLEPLFDDASHGYRPERSVMTALAQVVRARDQGLMHVLEADIESFFDRIHQPGLLQALMPHVGDAALVELLQQMLSPVIDVQGRQHLATRGVPQGSPLSPLLANLVLHPLDVGLRAAGHVMVRYADDFVVLARSAQALEAAHDSIRTLLAPLHLTLHPGKTRRTHFNDGFRFLGVRFQGQDIQPLNPGMSALMPQLDRLLSTGDSGWIEPAPEPLPLVPDDLVSSTPSGLAAAPLLNTVHVGEPGSALKLDGERLAVYRPGQPGRAQIPLAQVDQIAVSANVMLSSALLRHCARRRIAVYLADPAGGDEGASLDRGALPDLHLLQRQQDSASDPKRALALARALLDGKLHNSRVILRRYARRSGDEAQTRADAALLAIEQAQGKLPYAPDLDALRGHEGHAARAHFDALAALLPAPWEFDGRRRRPPPDPVNVLLSFGYAVLHANMLTLVRLAGLNAHVGVLHQARSGSHALVSDLIEEFRAVAVDAVVLAVLRDGRLAPQHFDLDSASEWPCRMTLEGRRIFVQALEDKLNSSFIHPRDGQRTDLRRAMQGQVQHWARCMADPALAYRPLKFR